MTNVLAYILADILDIDKFKSSNNDLLIRINNGVNIDFRKPEKHTRKDDLNLELLILVHFVTPKYLLMGRFVTYILAVSKIKPVYIWDGDCFLNANSYTLYESNNKYFIAVKLRKYNQSIIYNISGKEKSYIENIKPGLYIATKFLYIMYDINSAHIIGGVIKTDNTSDVTVYVYDNQYRAHLFICDIEGVLTNIDNLYKDYFSSGYVVGSEILYFLEPMTTNISNIFSNIIDTKSSILQPFIKDLSVKRKLNCLNNRMSYISSLPKDIKYSLKYAKKNHKLFKEMVDKSKEADISFFKEYSLSEDKLKNYCDFINALQKLFINFI